MINPFRPGQMDDKNRRVFWDARKEAQSACATTSTTVTFARLLDTTSRISVDSQAGSELRRWALLIDGLSSHCTVNQQ